LIKDFEVLEHTADVGIIAYGRNISQAFANAGKGLFYLITDLDSVIANTHRDIELTAADKEELMVDWLNDLIYLFDTDSLIFNRFDVRVTASTKLKATVYGERVDKSRHRLKTGIKAATYHMLKVERDDQYRVQVLFDI
jgi:SHS2 domain-containing protein